MVDDLILETPHGKLLGRRYGETMNFRGVPYAQPPIGCLRYREPVSAQPWAGTRDARRSKSKAIQPSLDMLALGRSRPWSKTRFSEDCLYADIWTPVEKGPHPVMVWLHSGGFLLGSGSSFLYHGRRLARHGVVTVALNYRLGALGLLDAPELSIPANLTLLDQIAALEWVRDHISAFGGDPRQITLFGSSAGAMSIGALLAAPRARGLFQRAILQSGAAESLATRKQSTDRSRAFLKHLGIETRRSPAETVRTLRELPVDRLLRAQSASLGESSPDRAQLPWLPTVDGDLLPESPLDAIRRGDAAEVEILLGTNLEEWKLITAFDRAEREMDDKELRRRTAVLLEQQKLSVDVEAFLNVYREIVLENAAGSKASQMRTEIWAAMRTDAIFRMPAVRLAEARCAAGAPVRMYRFDWKTPRAPQRLGAFHGLEIPFVFGVGGHPILRILGLGSPEATAISAEMQSLWTDFARGELSGWPVYDLESRAVRSFARSSRLPAAPGERERKLWLDQ